MQASIIIHYGEGPSTEETRVLGQLDLSGIPPAPRDIPRISVRFALSANHCLSVQVCDLDTQRQKDWSQRGDVVLTVAGNAGALKPLCK
jgi:molecular chaperone DnaK